MTGGDSERKFEAGFQVLSCEVGGLGVYGVLLSASVFGCRETQRLTPEATEGQSDLPRFSNHGRGICGVL